MEEEKNEVFEPDDIITDDVAEEEEKPKEKISEKIKRGWKKHKTILIALGTGALGFAVGAVVKSLIENKTDNSTTKFLTTGSDVNDYDDYDGSDYTDDFDNEDTTMEVEE